LLGRQAPNVLGNTTIGQSVVCIGSNSNLRRSPFSDIVQGGSATLWGSTTAPTTCKRCSKCCHVRSTRTANSSGLSNVPWKINAKRAFYRAVIRISRIASEKVILQLIKSVSVLRSQAMLLQFYVERTLQGHSFIHSIIYFASK